METAEKLFTTDNNAYAVTIYGNQDERDEVAYLLESLYYYIDKRPSHGWTEEEKNKAKQKIHDDVEKLHGKSTDIIASQKAFFTLDVINDYYRNELHGAGDTDYEVTDYIYNTEVYSISDDPIEFWSNTIEEREKVEKAINELEQEALMKGDLSMLVAFDKQFIGNPKVTGADILKYIKSID